MNGAQMDGGERCRIEGSADHSKTTIDWLRARVQAEPRDILEALRPAFGDDLGDHLNLHHLDRGILGFQQGAELQTRGLHVGRLDFGGASQRGWVRIDLNGKGCERMDWQQIHLMEALPCSQIRRIDIALTTWDGEVTHEMVVDAHQRGRFETGGRPPVLQQITSSDPRAGRTCYIGKRKADRFMRCYEKGFEMARQYLCYGQALTINGKRVEDIYRCEVEVKAQETDIPWSVIPRRDAYFTGAYPFCSDLLPTITTDVLMRRPDREAQVELQAALEHCRVQYGPTLYTALMAYQGDILAVWDRVIGTTHNETLLRAGVLIAEHD